MPRKKPDQPKRQEVHHTDEPQAVECRATRGGQHRWSDWMTTKTDATEAQTPLEEQRVCNACGRRQSRKVDPPQKEG